MPNNGQNPAPNVTVHSVITLKMKKQIDELVEEGDYLSLSDFIRQAVREKLEAK